MRLNSHVRQSKFQGSLEKTAIHLFSGAADTGFWDNRRDDFNFLFGSSKAEFDPPGIEPGDGSVSGLGGLHLEKDHVITID